MNRYKLYIFDMGGVVTSTAVLGKRMGEVLGIQESDFEEYSKGIFEQLSDGVISTKEFWRIFSERSGKTVTTDWWHWLFHPEPKEDTCSVIRKLKSMGCRVVCGTNTIDSHYRSHCERGDYQIFDQTYSSFLMGVSKPDVRFWQIILEAENVRPEDAVFIDDTQKNCDAAASLGIHTVHFTDAKSLAAELGL